MVASNEITNTSTTQSSKETLAQYEEQIQFLNLMIADRDAQLVELKKVLSFSQNNTISVFSLYNIFIRKFKINKYFLALMALIKTYFIKFNIWQVGTGTSKNRKLSIVNQPLNLTIADRNNYTKWISLYDMLDKTKRQHIINEIQKMVTKPKISIILPVYNPPIDLLDQAIWSVRNQLYSHWELCISDDASTRSEIINLLKQHEAEDHRIRVVFRSENGHISRASNSALELVSGEFIALLDHDDLLPEHALFWVADAIIKNPQAQLIYSDEDKIDLNGYRSAPYFKPDWNPELFLSHNFLAHLVIYRTELLREVGGWRVGFEGSQDYDLALRCIERIKPDQIIHIPRILYHWRIHPGSIAFSVESKPYAILNGERGLNEYLERCGISGKACYMGYGYRVQYALPDLPPLVSLLIPTRDGLHLLKRCVDSILEKTDYPNYEILIIDNGSVSLDTLEYLKQIQGFLNIKIIRDDRPFNYSALNNVAVKQARGDLVALVNNDIEVISKGWLSEMVSIALQPGVGVVGARLLYPNGTVQHCGVVLGIGGVAGHSHKHLFNSDFGYFSRMSLISNFSAVTGACLVIRKAIYEQVGGLNEKELMVAFNDVDFCLRVRDRGYRNVFTPYAELYHHESATRGFEDTPEKQARFNQEVNYMHSRWGNVLFNDPAYSLNLTLEHEDFSYAWPPRIFS